VILSLFVDGYNGNSRGVLWLFDKVGVHSGGFRELVGAGSECVGSDRPAKKGGDTRAGGGDRLIEAFSARAGAEVADHFVAGARKRLHIKGEILIKTADDQDGVLHGVGKESRRLYWQFAKRRMAISCF